jgi:hypothetical protein
VTILERYQSRFDVRDREGSLVAICKSHRAAQAFIDAWRPAEREAWRPKRVRGRISDIAREFNLMLFVWFVLTE